MNPQQFVHPDEIRAKFSSAMSDMYQAEVPLYSTLLRLVADTNTQEMVQDQKLTRHLQQTGETERLTMERHGAIRVGTAEELKMLRRLFAVMGMVPVGYYDLAPAGVRFTPPPSVRCMKPHCKPALSESSPHYCVWS